jgi:ABC-2 type transport system ATP-binding protein
MTIADPSPDDRASHAAALPKNAISARGLTKRYAGADDAAPALDGIDLDIPRGSFFGLLGPNGAGKSTFINILAGLVIKSAGRAAIWDCDIDANSRQARAAIGVVPQELNIDPFFTAREVLEFQAGLYGVPGAERRTAEILAAVHLTEQADIYARKLSGGMRRRLLVAKALVHNPPVLVLDEPTAGVDVEMRHQLWSYVQDLNARGVTVVLTTHYLEEAERLCDRIAIINKGKLVACDRTDELISRLDHKSITITLDDDLDAAPEALKRFETEILAYRRLTIRYHPSRTQVAEVLAAVQEAGLTIRDLTTEESDLEDLFLHITGGGGL